MNIINAQELADKQFNVIQLPRYQDVMGDIDAGFCACVWGRGGSGKSTFCLDLANTMAYVGKTLYLSAEEQHSKTFSDRIKRLNATHKNLHIAGWNEGGWNELYDYLKKNEYKFCFVDSLSVIDPNSKYAETFREKCKEAKIGLVFILHATKDGKYKGNSMVQHGVDIEIEVYEGKLRVNKTRYGASPEDYPVTFERKGYKELKETKTASTPKAKKNMRKNPMHLPFSTSLADIVKNRSVRGVMTLNKMFNDKALLIFRKNGPEESANGSYFRYKRDRKTKLSMLEFYHEGTLNKRVSGKNFNECLNKIVKLVNPEINIYDEKHAKLVLGAKEFRKQFNQKSSAKKTATKSRKKAAPKRKAKPASPQRKKAAPKRAKAKSKPKSQPKKKKDYTAIDQGIDALKNLLTSAIK